jgi:antitoxin component HigA of HigAB toxin-antitoxin module
MSIDIRPIRTDEDHAAAVAAIESLWEAEAGSADHDKLEVLGALVSAYEDQRWPIEPPDPIEAIKIRMEQTGRSQSDLAELVGSASRASEILNRRRRLTLEMIWRLNREWRIPAEILVRPYRIARHAKRAGKTFPP